MKNKTMLHKNYTETGLNINSPTEDLLKFAKLHGYGSGGMDFSPSWMSVELHKRGY